jgi:E3 ubiquitin-protein ligase RNFT1
MGNTEQRKLYGIIEVTSIIVRSLLAGLPWCSYYQLCGSTFLGDVFTFLYVFGKSVILGTQARQLLSLVRSFLTLGLDHATYVTREEVVEAGSPDCSICYEPMQMPVKLACTHLFCEDCVMEWLDRERSCPLCRAPIVSTTQSTDGKPQYLDGSTSLFPQLF